MTILFAGGLRNRTAFGSASRLEPPRAGRLGTDSSNRLGASEQQHAGQNL